MPAYATGALVLSAVADMLKVPQASLPSYWTNHSTRAAAASQMEHQNRLLRRGFTAAQVLDWPMLDTSSLTLGTWYALGYGGAYGQFDPKVIEALDVREDLDRALVWDSVLSLWVQPGEGSAGNTSSAGPIVTQDSGVFRWDESDSIENGGSGNLGIWW